MTMTLIETRPTTSHRLADSVGTTLAAAPIIVGVGASVLALFGRFGGTGEAITAFWYVAAACAPLALLGAVVLLLTHRHGGALRDLGAWSAVSVGGYAFAAASALLTGLATDPDAVVRPWQQGLVGLGVAGYLIGLVGLVASATVQHAEGDATWRHDTVLRRVTLVLHLAVAMMYGVVLAIQLPHLTEPDNPAPVYAVLALGYLAMAVIATISDTTRLLVTLSAVQLLVLGLFAWSVGMLYAEGDEAFILDMQAPAFAITLTQVAVLALLGVRMWRRRR